MEQLLPFISSTSASFCGAALGAAFEIARKVPMRSLWSQAEEGVEREIKCRELNLRFVEGQEKSRESVHMGCVPVTWFSSGKKP